MLTTFTIIGVLGLLIAVAALLLGDILDGIFDVDFAPDGALSTSSVAASLAGFGFGGAIAITVFGVETTWVAIVIAAVIGAAAWAVSLLMFRQLERQSQPAGATDISQIVGETAIVLTAPPKTTSMGELTVTFQGQPHKMNFLCSRKVAVGQEVVVTTVVSSSQVRVKPKEGSQS